MIHSNEHLIPRRNIIWSWVLKVYLFMSSWALWLWSLLPSFKNHQPEPKPKISAKQLSQLPADVDIAISEYLKLDDIKNVMQPHGRLFKGFYDKMNSDSVKCSVLLRKFLYLIAIEKEKDKQSKAEAMLKKYPQLVSLLISKRYLNLPDAAGRCFLTPMSGYGYVYWSGDASFRYMMERYMDEETKASVLKECQAIATYGVTFTLNGEVFTESHHFDFQPLIHACRVFIAASSGLVVAGNSSGAAWAPIEILWLNIGKEFAKLPTNVEEEYCMHFAYGYSLVLFLREPNIRCAYYPGNIESWLLNASLATRAWVKGHSRNIFYSMRKEVPAYLEGMSARFEVETVADLKQTLEYDLQPIALGVALTA
ncbi:MAG: hypothetical protein KBB94_04730 [Legionellaceae bacterium]|nr:hypothetical protein [Legionellaceae bacterium]MBP9774552.1 hypothetical protein [Legionellaceae bacterium]